MIALAGRKARLAERPRDTIFDTVHIIIAAADASLRETLLTQLRAAESPQGRPPSGGASARLTEREREVLESVAAGVSNKGIARRLGLSPNTVKYHITALLTKLGASTRAEAVAAAARRGELSL